MSDYMSDNTVPCSAAQYRSDSLRRSVDEEGTCIYTINDYILLQEVGRGTASVVYLAIKNPTEEMRAVKAVPRDRVHRVSTGDERLIVEAAIMARIHHPHVVALYECIDDPTAEFVYLVMQYIPDGAIAEFDNDGTCTPLKGGDVGRYMRQLVHALAHIHAQGVVHGDIKPANILIDKKLSAGDGSVFEPSAYLSGFSASHGLFGTVDQRGVAEGLGTPVFFAPEVFAGADSTQASDVWALGVTFFALIYGRLPFEATSLADLAQQVETHPVVFTPTDCGETDPALQLDADICAVLSRMLVRDPDERITAAELQRNLTHSPALPTPIALAIPSTDGPTPGGIEAPTEQPEGSSTADAPHSENDDAPAEQLEGPVSTRSNTNTDGVDDAPPTRLFAELLDVVQEGNSVAVAELLRQMPQLARIPDEAGVSPLHHAVSHGHLGIVRLLVDACPLPVGELIAACQFSTRCGTQEISLFLIACMGERLRAVSAVATSGGESAASATAAPAPALSSAPSTAGDVFSYDGQSSYDRFFGQHHPGT